MALRTLSYYSLVLGRFRPFLVLFVVYLVAVFVTTSVARIIMGEITINGASAAELGLIQLDKTFQTESWLTLWFNYLLGLALMLAIGAEQQAGMMRMQIMSGLSRLGYTSNIVILAVFTGLVATVLVVSANLITSIDAVQATPMDIIVKVICGQLLTTVAMLLFAGLCLIFWVRSLPAAVCYVLTPMLLEPLLAWVIERYGDIPLENYLPFAAIRKLVPLPYSFETTAAPLPLPLGPTLLCGAYCFVFALLIYLTIRRRDC